MGTKWWLSIAAIATACTLASVDRAAAQVTRLGSPMTAQGSTAALPDGGVAVSAARIDPIEGSTQSYIYTAGQISTAADDSLLFITRNPFDCEGIAAADHSYIWPTTTNRDPAIRRVKAMVVDPGRSHTQPEGATTVYVAARVPGTSGHWDLLIIALDEALKTVHWTSRIANADDADTPVHLAIGTGTPRELVVGYTAGATTKHMWGLVFSNQGVVEHTYTYNTSATHDASLTGIKMVGNYVYMAGTAYSALDDRNKFATVTWDTLGQAVVELVNPSDGLEYRATASAFDAPLSTLSVIAITGTRTANANNAGPHDYFTSSSAFLNGAVVSSWSMAYAGSAGGDDVPLAVYTRGVSVNEGFGRQWTWVTGRSQRAGTLDDDAVTILYDKIGTSAPVVPWISRWDGGYGAGGVADAGVALAAIEANASEAPDIYVLAQTGSGPVATNGQNYLYLSYDIDPIQSGFETKTTRWATTLGDTLPPHCFWGVTNGDSIPSGIGVFRFDGTGCKYMIRTGQSWNGTAAMDLVTTLERDETP